jgi:hypothetical protein
VSTGIEREASAALHRAVNQLDPPRLDVDAIRRAGRRRKAHVAAAAAIALIVVVVVTAGVTTGRLLLGTTPHPVTTGGSATPAASPSLPQPTASIAPGPAAAIANVRAFYTRYSAALTQGRGAIDALIRAHMASWYVPILEVPPIAGAGTLDCGAGAAARDLRYQQAGAVGGQDIVVARWSTSAQVRYIVVTAQPGTGKITGITCTGAGNDVTSAGARDAAASMFPSYLQARRKGTSAYDALAALMLGGPNTGSPYLRQLQEAVSRRLSYDPVLCSPAGVPSVTVGPVTVVGGGSAGLVVITPGHSHPMVAVIVLGAKGWTVADIACQRP